MPPQTETGTMRHHKQRQAQTQTQYGSLTGLQGGAQFVRRTYIVLVEVVYGLTRKMFTSVHNQLGICCLGAVCVNLA